MIERVLHMGAGWCGITGHKWNPYGRCRACGKRR
jgi:hypothetical protein